ncbi:L-ribulose-5-phosphate 4-epimerase [Liquorilactobacillus vini]|uniref:L-ribulose-5-phosphate 4-epimerase n=1 Tax=Liquorilactobacillus vini DSM 20605 TaxID=1133569 RepID=A0A0A7RMF0_9LACO|nr:L-ribulose-5-phosphate 4-epimerase [Liquorilactobacillus vini]AJA34458.1 L-ribulose 5-phosphate 4-epimerase [Liquorilactobacillus vini DSM 20605]KRM86266.1 L-ribulose-5-phosphate 4-epimerase [Liquorilactobacillus vini DSM 20605]
MLEDLKRQVYEANMQLPRLGLVNFTWGNVSGIDRGKGLFVIKPSGVPYEKLKPSDLVVVDLNGKVIEGDLRPSSDTPTHAVLYRHFLKVGGITHTHSPWAVSYAAAGRGIPVLNTTHADTFYGEVPVTRNLTANEIQGDYEKNTGKVIIDTFKKQHLSPAAMKAVLVNQHGPFTWGKNASESVYNAKVLEVIAEMNYHTLLLNPAIKPVSPQLLNKHYLRKHGKNAYYGQKNRLGKK